MWQPRRVVRWVLLGLLASLVELALLRGLVEGLLWPLPLATVVAAEVLIICKFLVNDRFVFGYPWPNLTRLVRYHGASAGALIVYWVVLNALSLFGGVAYVAAFVIGTAAAFTWSLITNFVWVWEQHNLPKGPAGYAQSQPYHTRELSRGE
ncbi:MAG: GtrA family protein [Chloroflexi bacterium]|nr:GtrA family protein [Chloroflexota bacterium]MBV9600898.1 GtrA family protein [Chloroflexota bacterium]